MSKRSKVIRLGMLLSVGLTLGWSGPASAASCTISPQNPTVDAGKTLAWSATYSGFRRTPSFSWAFSGATPSTSTSSRPTVTYSRAGSSTTTLRLSSFGTSATCSTGVTVRSGSDTTPPTVALAASAPGPFNPPASVTLTATASDNVGVTRVEFYDGATLKGTDTTAPYAYGWSIVASDAGSHSWTARAYDAAGNSRASSAVTLVVNGGSTAPNVSINSTSQSSMDVGVDPDTLAPVTQAPRPKNANSLSPTAGTGTTGYQVLAINDLGMHCGDLDTRVASILPPFQVLLSQVIRKGGEPRILGPTEVQVVYSAASNPSDPILSTATDPATGYPFTGLTDNGGVFKTNFWDIAYQAYNPFYPPGILCNPNGPTPAPCFAVNPDVGLPVPNVEQLYIGPDGRVKSGDESLTAVQHAMPGVANPYVRNDAQTVEEHYGDKPFFVNFPFGYVANDVNWFEGAGVPFAAFDDAGRENPYPLVRVQAKSTTGAVLATVDTVLPISGEASCKNCHGHPADVDSPNEGVANTRLNDARLPVASSLDDPAEGPDMPNAVSVEYATDINILRLHDFLHGAAYRNSAGAQTPCSISSSPNGSASCLTNQALVQKKAVVCQVCHYTPALDLAQVGPLGGVGGTADKDANGRVQRIHQSNSRVLHMAHATHTALFPPMPAPTADSATTGLPGNQAQREAVLEQTCYQCHPGNKTKCMRGAMADGGMVCQDCHGQMAQVGDDFTVNMKPGSAFPRGVDLTRRVPWASEPGCGSCHTGDATSNLAGSTGTLRNGYDTNGIADNIRLLRAYRSTDAKATPIVPTNKRFAENTVPASFNGFANPAAGKPKLYRVSTGHGGVMCEGCHGATHAEWDSDGSPLMNDNVTANQIQGHSGTVMECNACHVTSALSGSTQGGPHGMHLVNDSRWYAEGHEDAAKAENAKPNGGSCAACHGADHRGTVLSRTPVTRTFNVEGSARTVQAGRPVGCDHCHSLSDSFEAGD